MLFVHNEQVDNIIKVFMIDFINEADNPFVSCQFEADNPVSYSELLKSSRLQAQPRNFVR